MFLFAIASHPSQTHARSGALMFIALALTSTMLAQPSIGNNAIVNATGYQTTLAPDTVFVIFGSGMGPATLAGASAPNYPTSLGGTSITFTPASGGAAIPAKMIYTGAGQVAGLLPSSIAPGVYSVQLTYNTQTSAPQNVTVAARSFGIATSNSGGTGAAQATIGNVNGGISLVRLTSGALGSDGLNWTLTPAHPGDTLVLWGTGGGADSSNDTGGTSGDQTAAGNFSVNVDGTAITPLYAGASSGYPGLWQINFTLPATSAPDCFASVQVSAGGQLSNGVTIAIAPAGQTSCTNQVSPATLSKLDSGGNIIFAGLSIGHIVGYYDGVGGVFNRYTAAEWLLPYSGLKFGLCTVLDETYPAGGKDPIAADAQLDAGTLTISGPGLSSHAVGVTQTATGPAYATTLTEGTLVNGGTYTLTASGGTQVGPFTVSATMPSSFTVTNLSSLSAINRAQPLTINWTGAGIDLVYIGVQGGTLTSTTTHGVLIQCTVPAGPGTYSIPPAALAYLPAVAAGSSNSVGQISIQGGPGGTPGAGFTQSTSLTPNLVGGGQADFGDFAPYIAYLVSATIQ